MFSNAQSLPPLSAFTTTDFRPLRLTASQSQPLPTGECRFILLHPSISNQRCTCQSFHHNGKPGSTCDCGHQACYHVHSSPTSTGNNSPVIPWLTHTPSASDTTISALLDRIGILEQALEDERQARMEDMKQEHRLRERDIRLLREALHPFYRTETEMRKKLVELEDRIEGNYDEQVQMKERLIEVDDAAMVLEKRLDELDGPRPKRRRFGRKQYPGYHKVSNPSDSSPPSSDPSRAPRRIGGDEKSLPSPPKPATTPHPPRARSAGRDNECPPSSTVSVHISRSPLQRSVKPQPYNYATVFYASGKPNVDSASITEGMLAAAMPMFHSSLAPGSDPEGDRTDEDDDEEGKGDASPRIAEVHPVPMSNDDEKPIVLTTEDAGAEVAKTSEVKC